MFNTHNEFDAYKRFDGLHRMGIGRIVYHGDSRSWDTIKAANGLKRYIINPAMPKPTIMDGGGTKNSVTTTANPAVAISYSARGGSAHVKARGEKLGDQRFIYAIYCAPGKGIELSQLPRSDVAAPRTMTHLNARSQEIMMLDISIEEILGYRIISSVKVGDNCPAVGDYFVNPDCKFNAQASQTGDYGEYVEFIGAEEYPTIEV